MRREIPRSPLVIGIDLGGTNMQIGVVDARHRIVGRDRRKTLARQGFQKTLLRIVEGVNVACVNAGVLSGDIAAVGIAAPGAIDIPRGVVLEAPNLRWSNIPLRAALSKLLRRPVVLDNDVNAAVWGEYKLGACSKNSDRKRTNRKAPTDVLGVWLGTGVGGGLVIDSQLFHGQFFTAGEIGQTILFPEGKKGRRILEDFCSRTGISRTMRLQLPYYPTSSLHKILKKPGDIADSEVIAATYRNRDKLTVATVDQAADFLGIAIANAVTVLSLDTVIIGGGVAEVLGQPFINKVRASFNRDVFPKKCRETRLVMTTLKDDAGLLGAALLAQQTQTL